MKAPKPKCIVCNRSPAEMRALDDGQTALLCSECGASRFARFEAERRLEERRHTAAVAEAAKRRSE